MALKDFSEYLYCKMFDTNETIKLGKYTMAESGLLASARPLVMIQNYNELNGNEELLMKLYNDQYLQSLYCQSLPIRLSDIDFKSLGTSYLGYLKFELPENPITAGESIYPTITISNYIESESNFIGLIYDYPIKIYTNPGSLFINHPICLQIFLLQNEA